MGNHRPNLEVRFHTREGNIFTVKNAVSWSSSRSLNNAYSTATISFSGLYASGTGNSLVDGRAWGGKRPLVRKKDLVGIYATDGNGKLWPDVVGMVSSVVVNEGESFGVSVNSVQISIAGLGRALSDYMIFYHPHLSNTPGLMNGFGLGAALVADGSPPSGRPDQVCKSIFEKFFSSEYVFHLADGRNLSDVIRLDFAEVKDSLDQMALNTSASQMSVWEVLRRYCDSPWNELFVDLDADTGDLVLRLRPTPFNLHDWNVLKNKKGWGFDYDASTDRVGMETLLNDEDQVFSFFMCNAGSALAGIQNSTIQSKNTNGKLPIYDRELIERYGFKALEKDTEYIQILNEAGATTSALSIPQKKDYNTDQSDLVAMLQKRTATLYLWFGFDEFQRGSFEMVGRIGQDPHYGIRCGGVMTRKRDGLELYITEVNQSWTMESNHWHTSVTVERGHYPDDYRAWVRKQITNRGLESVLEIDT